MDAPSTEPNPGVHYRIEQPNPQRLLIICGDTLMATLNGGHTLVIAAKFYAAQSRAQDIADLYAEGIIDGILQVASEGMAETMEDGPPDDPPFPDRIGHA